MPPGLAVNSVVSGAVFALWPVMWIVLNALLLYNIAVESGRFDAFRAWLIDHVPQDKRVVLVVIGFCFGCLLEGISGFGTPVAITSSLLILVGFPALEALVFVLIFNTAPVAFGALGAPITVLGAVTGLPAHTLGAMIGRQLPVIALLFAFLRHRPLRRPAVAESALAAVAGRGRQLCRLAIHLIELSRLRADRRVRGARFSCVHAAFPAGLAAGTRPGVCDFRRRREKGDRGAAHCALARLDTLAHRFGRRDHLDAFQLCDCRRTGNPLARPRQGHRDHAL